MMEAPIKRHIYKSASPALDAAMTQVHHMNDDAAFRDMICTFVTQACKDHVRLFCPTDRSDNNNPLIFMHGNTQVYAFYTDRDAALLCAQVSMPAPNSFLHANTGEIPLWRILEAARSGVILVFNMGLPNEVILPEEILHTIYHLMRTNKYHVKEPADSAWQDWIGILQQFIADGKDQQIYDEMVEMPETILRIPVTPPSPGMKKLYRLG